MIHGTWADGEPPRPAGRSLPDTGRGACRAGGGTATGVLRLLHGKWIEHWYDNDPTQVCASGSHSMSRRATIGPSNSSP